MYILLVTILGSAKQTIQRPGPRLHRIYWQVYLIVNNHLFFYIDYDICYVNYSLCYLTAFYTLCRWSHCDTYQKVWNHDDVTKWKKFLRHWPFVRGIHRWPVDSPHKGQWRGALMLCLICAWTNGWANNRDAVIGDAITLIMKSLWWLHEWICWLKQACSMYLAVCFFHLIRINVQMTLNY